MGKEGSEFKGGSSRRFGDATDRALEAWDRVREAFGGALAAVAQLLRRATERIRVAWDDLLVVLEGAFAAIGTRRARASRRLAASSGLAAALLAGLAALRDRVGAGVEWLASMVREPRPSRIVVLSVAALAAGGLGLMVAFATTSGNGKETYQVLVTNGHTLRIMTVTGPSGTTTVAVSKTKTGKPKLVPIRILKTITGPGGTQQVQVAVTGPPVTLSSTDTEILTQIATHAVTQHSTATLHDTLTQVQTQQFTTTLTNVITETPPAVTNTVTNTVTDTQVVTVTQTVTETVQLPGITVTITAPAPPSGP